MPEVSRFYGIVVQMFFYDHEPPHFHVVYGEYKVVVSIEDGLVKGFMPKRALKLIFEWMEAHQAELMENWDRTQKGELPFPIEPLT